MTKVEESRTDRSNPNANNYLNEMVKPDDMLKLFHLGGKTLSKGELTVLFRKPTNKHYKPCGDELLSAFLEGVNKSDEHPR